MSPLEKNMIKIICVLPGIDQPEGYSARNSIPKQIANVREYIHSVHLFGVKHICFLSQWSAVCKYIYASYLRNIRIKGTVA